MLALFFVAVQYQLKHVIIDTSISQFPYVQLIRVYSSEDVDYGLRLLEKVLAILDPSSLFTTQLESYSIAQLRAKEKKLGLWETLSDQVNTDSLLKEWRRQADINDMTYIQKAFLGETV